MKISIATSVVVLALLSLGCGDGGAGTATDGAATAAAKTASRLPTLSDGDDPRFATVSGGGGKPPGPDIDPPPGRPSPKAVLIRDLEVGSGPAADRGDQVAVRYLGVNYETGVYQLLGWLPSPSTFQLGFSQFAANVWQEGLIGMQEGGRRELILPARFATGYDAIDYVVEMVRVEPASKAPPGG
jgi:peptidylprolyl isomerase